MRRSWLQEQSAQALPALDDTRAYRPVARGGLSCIGRLNAIGETPERRLWVYKREVRRAAFARRSVLALSVCDFGQFLSLAVRTACHNSGPGRSKDPSIQSLLPPRL